MFDEWWNSRAADAFRAANPDADGEQFRCIWDAATETVRTAFDDECNRTDSLLTILGVPAERCRSEGGSLIPRKVLTLMGEARANGHDSDCATHNAPAYPPGPCDCMPTQAMCRAAVVYLNGSEVYDKLPRKVLEIEEGIYAEVWEAMQAAAPKTHTDDAADALRFRWLCENPDWHFIERLCREFVADSSMEFLAELRRVIDARRSVELGAFEQHLPPDDLAWEREADRITRAALGNDVTRAINPNARSVDDL